MSNESLIPTDENPHPLLSLSGEERKRFVFRSVFITIALTVIIYVLIPNYVVFEILITRASISVLELFGFEARYFMYEDSLSEIGTIDLYLLKLYDPTRASYPSISMDTGYGRSNFLIVRACTGMQAGGLLVGLIWATPAKLHDRIRASYTILLYLFIGNVLRIAAQIGMTLLLINNFNINYDIAWIYAHDWSGRPIGFFGTIAFTILIERRKVRILDTITVWTDFITGAKPKPKADAEQITEKSIN